MRKGLLLASLAVFLSAATAAPSWAQAIGGGESERVLRPYGYYPPYDGMSVSQRYNFETGSFFFLNQDPRGLYWADYFDRLERAHKFGYCPPREPCFPNARGCWEPRFGWGLGVFRLR